MRVGHAFSKIVVIFVVSILIMVGNSVGQAATMSTQDRATWLWNTEMIVDDETKVLHFLESKGISKLYLQINRDIASNDYKSFIGKATTKGIKVYALDGSPSWVSADGRNMNDELMDWITSYNNNAASFERFVGIHLDVEPYLNSGWRMNQAQTIQSYQALLIKAKEDANHIQVPLEVDIPFWFDEVIYRNPYGLGLLSEWVIDRVDSVTIMAYRDSAKEISKIVKNEIVYAEKVNKSIVVGVETSASDEGQNITFYEEGEARMNEQLALVRRHYAKKASYQGVAIHHVEDWRKMLP